jgi:hypothetical protein
VSEARFPDTGYFYLEGVSADRVALARRLLGELVPAAPGTFIDHSLAVRAIAGAFVHGMAFEAAARRGVRACRVCGCTETRACAPDPCFWVAADLCSACRPYVAVAA